MSATFVILLSCFASVIVASGPSSSYLPPVGGHHAGHSAPVVSPTIGQPGASGHGVSGSAISRQSALHLSPVKRGVRLPSAVGQATSAHVAAFPVASAPIVHRPTLTGVPPTFGVGRPHSYSAAAALSVQRPTVIGGPSNVGVVRPTVQGSSAIPSAVSAPLAQRPSFAGVVGRTIPSVGTGVARQHSSGRQHGGHKDVSGYGSRTVGSKAPY